jgi:hypothetical protein
LTQPEQPKLIGDTLLNDLKDTPTNAVGDATQRVNHFTIEDEDHDRRFGKAQRRRTFQKIQRWFFWFLFWVVCAFITTCAAGYLFIVWKWVSTLIWEVKVHNPTGLKSFIDGVLWSLLIVFATLFLEGVFRDRGD